MKNYEEFKKAVQQHITLVKNTNVRSIQEYLMTKHLHATQVEISLIIQQIQTEQRQSSQEPIGDD